MPPLWCSMNTFLQWLWEQGLCEFWPSLLKIFIGSSFFCLGWFCYIPGLISSSMNTQQSVFMQRSSTFSLCSPPFSISLTLVNLDSQLQLLHSGNPVSRFDSTFLCYGLRKIYTHYVDLCIEFTSFVYHHPETFSFSFDILSWKQLFLYFDCWFFKWEGNFNPCYSTFTERRRS